MAGINLAQGAQREETRRSERRGKRGMLLVFFFLVVTFGAWGTLAWYDHILTGEITGIDGDIRDAWKEISGEDLSRVADFHFRLEAIDAGLEEIGRPRRMFGVTESGVDPGVVFSRLDFEKSDGSTVLEGTANDFQSIVRQLVSLKGDSVVSDVALNTLGRTDDGKLDFSLSVDMAGNE